MIFLTYNDNFSGIYQSQVIDVCLLFKKEHRLNVKLIALVSLRNYSTQKKLILSAYKNSLVVPMFPKARFWKFNILFLFFICLLSRKKKIWARGPFACNMALSLKKAGLLKKVIFDARGAYSAELNEYNVVPDEKIKNSISAIEKKALFESDAQLAVSRKLQEWWKEQYNFDPFKSVIIPCTLSDHFAKNFPSEKEIQLLRKGSGFSNEDIVLVYSGSSAGWQSFALVDNFLQSLFSKEPNVKLLFLSDEIPHKSKTFNKYKDRIFIKWVKPSEVRNLLLIADYGLLIREDSVTNKVASPVKFAEYLACGLQLIISKNIGDFSEFVLAHKCGSLYSDAISLDQVSFQQKIENNKLALYYFSKESAGIKKEYARLLE